MSVPVLWLRHKFFYPVGNTPAIDLTAGLPYEEDAAVLLLGCGDVRNIIYSFYAGLSASRDDFCMDVTCCDIEPGILARNVLILTLLVDGCPPDQLWNVAYHFRVDHSCLDLIQAQCRKLTNYARSVHDWNACPYGRWIRFCNTHTLHEVHRYWTSYLAPITESQQKSILDDVSKLWNERGRGGRSRNTAAGQYALRSLSPTDRENFDYYWRTGVIAVNSSIAQNATKLNPTFFHSLNGTGVHFHHRTYPLDGFQLAEVYARITSDGGISKAKSQFHMWGQSFRNAILRKTSTVVLRLYAGDALACCRPLSTPYQELPCIQIPIAAWYGGCALLDGGDYEENALRPAPTMFNVIDTSNLVDHLAHLNVIIAASPLLAPSSTSTLYTTTFDAEDTGLPRLRNALLMDIDTAAMLLGITPLPYTTGFTSVSHGMDYYVSELRRRTSGGSTDKSSHDERIAWKRTAPQINEETETRFHPFFLPQDLAQIIFNVHQEMMPAERLAYRRNTYALGTREDPDEDLWLRVPRFHRESLVALLVLLKQRNLTDDWTKCIESFFDLFHSQDPLMLSANYRQELCGLLHRYAVYTVEDLRSGHCPVPALDKKGEVFELWKDIPTLVCVTIVVPRSALTPVEAERPGGLDTPAFELSIFTPGMERNLFAAIRCAWGHITISGTGESKRVELHEVPCRVASPEAPDLVVFTWVPSWVLVAMGVQDTTVMLSLGSSSSVGRFMVDLLGPHLAMWKAGLGDKEVHVTKGPPALHATSTSRFTTVTSPRASEDPQKKLRCAVVTAGQCRPESLTARYELKHPLEKKLLQDGAKVGVQQLSPWSIELLCGYVRKVITLPVAVDASRLRTRVARKSGYIEIIGIPCREPDDPSSTLKSYDFMMQMGRRLVQEPCHGRPPYSWAFHHVRVDRLPVLKYHVGDTTKDIEPEQHLELALSRRQRELVDSINDTQDFLNLGNQLINKYLINCMFAKIFESRPLLFPDAIRMDPAAGTNLIECFILPLESPNPAIDTELSRLSQFLFSMQLGHADSLRALIPSFVERCRTWEHKPTCEYRRAGSASLIICSCGAGIGAAEARCFGTDNPLRSLTPYVTRAAISQLFMPSYIEPLGDISDLMYGRSKPSTTRSREQAEQDLTTQCSKCMKVLERDLQCSRCKQVSYCGAMCQKADWKMHKKVCRAI